MFRKNRKVPPPDVQNGNETTENNNGLPKNLSSAPVANSLQFYCQLAHGSPTAFVSGFSNVRELYSKIGEAFDMPASDIIFCTLNTFKPDMKKLLGGQIGLEDFIFAHRKGRAKEIELIKSEDSLGLTITDNGAGYSFIKRIKEGSIIANSQHIKVGDHIEKLNDQNMVGKRHFEVATALKNIPLGSLFTIRLIEPMTSGFGQIAPKGNARVPKKAGYGNGKGTLRFKAGGHAEIQNQDDAMDLGIEKINGVLETFLGINDSELASQIWDMSDGKLNSMEFAEAIDDSDLAAFQFDDDLIIELWGCVTDARQNRFN